MEKKEKLSRLASLQKLKKQRNKEENEQESEHENENLNEEVSAMKGLQHYNNIIIN